VVGLLLAVCGRSTSFLGAARALGYAQNGKEEGRALIVVAFVG
jgi:hypothetical protein